MTVNDSRLQQENCCAPQAEIHLIKNKQYFFSGGVNHRITESLRLGKTFEIIQSNLKQDLQILSRRHLWEVLGASQVLYQHGSEREQSVQRLMCTCVSTHRPTSTSGSVPTAAPADSLPCHC